MKRSFQALVTCNGGALALPGGANKRLCQIVDVATAADVKLQLASACCLAEQGFTAEYFDKDFDEWIPLDDPLCLEDNKVKICLKRYDIFSSSFPPLLSSFAFLLCFPLSLLILLLSPQCGNSNDTTTSDR